MLAQAMPGNRMLAALLFSALAVSCATTATERFVLPPDTYGWVEIRWGVKGAPPLGREDAFRFGSIPMSGIVETSEDVGTTSTPGQFIYQDEKGRRSPAPMEGGGYTFQGYGRPGRISFFIFIGKEAEARQAWPMAKDKNPVPGLVKRR
jgi:hypothetical protein